MNGLGGRDRITGTRGHDDLYGDKGNDRIFGGHDNDYIVGDRGEDQLNGGFGDDVIVSGDDKLADEVVCGPGEDIAYLSGPDHSSLANDCEEVETFESFEEITNPEGTAGG